MRERGGLAVVRAVTTGGAAVEVVVGRGCADVTSAKVE